MSKKIACFVLGFLTCLLIIQLLPSSEIVKGLVKHESVKIIEVAPDVDYIVDTGDRSGTYDFGPATILVITDLLEGEK